MGRQFELKNPSNRNQENEKTMAKSSYEAADIFLQRILKDGHFPPSMRKKNTTMPFYLSLEETSNNGKKRLLRHFKFQVKLSTRGNKDTWNTPEQYTIPEKNEGFTVNVSRSNIPAFVNESVVGGSNKKERSKKKKRKGIKKGSCDDCILPSYHMYWPHIYGDPLYLGYFYSGYYPYVDWTFGYGFPFPYFWM